MPRVDSGRVRGKAGQLLPLPTAHTQSHLRIDGYYLDGLDKGARGLSIESEVPFPRLSDPAVAQRATDAGLVRYCDGLTEKALEEVVNSNVVSMAFIARRSCSPGCPPARRLERESRCVLFVGAAFAGVLPQRRGALHRHDGASAPLCRTSVTIIA